MNFDPNPLFYEMVSIFINNRHKKDKVTICNEGSSRCFCPETKVVTKNGSVKIKDLQANTEVLTYNESKKVEQYKPIKEVLKFQNRKPCYRITLKNGDTIEATQDHEFYYEGAWHSLKHIVSLWNERENINKRKKD